MIPLTLHIKNFVSYGAQQTIDFEPYSLMCLSGKNGHGKSALLDALTWAVWGQARKASGVVKADEGLLHLGQTHMMVSLDFICNGITYRVKREYIQKKKTGQSTLEFGVLAEDNSFKPLTDKTIRATQAKIIATVGLDYEGFVNSAFLRQGRSQEFSKKTPRERKEILASILGLDHFEKVRRLAMDIINQTQADKAQTGALIERLTEELKEQPVIQEQLTQLEATLKHREDQEQELTKQQIEHKKLLEKAQQQKVEVEKIRFKQTHLAQALEQELTTIRNQFSTWRSLAKKQRSSKTFPHLEKERQQVQKELNDMQLLGAQKVKLKETYLVKQQALTSLQQELEKAHTTKIAELEKQAHTCTVSVKTTHQKQQELTQKQVTLAKELQELTTLITSKKSSTLMVTPELIATNEKRLERRKSFYHGFVSKATSLKSTLSSLMQKIQLIASSSQAVCPLCEQVTDKDKLTHKFSQEQHLRKHQLERLTNVCTNLKPALIEEHRSLESLKKEREKEQIRKAQVEELEKQQLKLSKEATAVTHELTVVAKELEHLNKTQQELTLEKQRLEVQYKQQIHTDAYRKLYQEVQATQKSLNSSPYDPTKEQALAAQLSALTAHSTQQQSLVKELALQDERKRTIHEKCSSARELKYQLAALTKTMPASLVDQVSLLNKEQQLTTSLTNLTKEKELLIHKKGSLEAQAKALTIKAQELKKQITLTKDLDTKSEEYSALSAAFSKDGIQALLIEDALPEIEEEANNLLSRLTDNQAHISIDSLKDTKSGKTKETLDIKISDAAGVRPYEMFSGGEAFRIDFSLRVGLSKLLARRAGTALQTLIIDEGFGSQDEDGLSHIMEALHAIHNDFAKIIVVSHLTSLKEQFPVHFQVQKTPQGSMVRAIEHC